jgi:16S rRNA (adenine1518-N6/adenine1519-N6)-dimethyltransferase
LKLKRTTIQWIRQTLEASGKTVHKSLGQHYLINEGAVRGIAKAAAKHNPGFVVEIGSGLGVLTEALLAENLFVSGVEIEKDSIKVLEDDFLLSHPNHFRVIAKDFLECSAEELLEQSNGQNVLLTGNLPYQITSPILFRCAEDLLPHISGGLFMMQKEVAERIRAPFGSRQYGILSVLLQMLFNVSSVLTLSPSSFYPPPKVDSQVLLLIKKNPLPVIRNWPILKSIVKSAFNQRRKKISTALANTSISDFDPIVLKKLFEAKRDLCDQRAEDLSWENYLILADFYLDSLESKIN